LTDRDYRPAKNRGEGKRRGVGSVEGKWKNHAWVSHNEDQEQGRHLGDAGVGDSKENRKNGK